MTADGAPQAPMTSATTAAASSVPTGISGAAAAVAPPPTPDAPRPPQPKAPWWRKPWLWLGGLSGLLVVAQTGFTPERSEDLRVAILDSCPVSKGGEETAAAGLDWVLALGQAAAGPLLTSAVGLVKAAGQAHSAPLLTGQTAEHFYVSDGRGNLRANEYRWRCLVVVLHDLRQDPAELAAAQQARDAAAASAALLPALPSASTAPSAGRSTAKVAPQDAYSSYRIYMEAEIVFAKDRSAFELRPVTLRLRAPADSSLLGSAARDLAFQVAFSKPGAAAPFASTAVHFKSLLPAPTLDLRVDSLGGNFAKRSGWLAAYPLDDAIKQALAAQAAALVANKPATVGAGAAAAVPSAASAAAAAETVAVASRPPRSAVHAPTTVSVTVLETREGSALWKLLGSTLDGWLPSVAGP